MNARVGMFNGMNHEAILLSFGNDVTLWHIRYYIFTCDHMNRGTFFIFAGFSFSHYRTHTVQEFLYMINRWFPQRPILLELSAFIYKSKTVKIYCSPFPFVDFRASVEDNRRPEDLSHRILGNSLTRWQVLWPWQSQ